MQDCAIEDNASVSFPPFSHVWKAKDFYILVSAVKALTNTLKNYAGDEENTVAGKN